jgi:cell division protein FtsN
MTNKKKRGRNDFSSDFNTEEEDFILADLDNVHNDQDLALVDLSNFVDDEEVINTLLVNSTSDYKDEFEHDNFPEDFVINDRNNTNELLDFNLFLIEPIEHDSLTQPEESISLDSQSIIPIDHDEKEEYFVTDSFKDEEFKIDIPLNEGRKVEISKTLIDTLLSGIEISKSAGFDFTGPREDQIISMVESGNYVEAASLSEAMLLDGIFDMRLVCYFLYGYWLDKGLVSLADVLNSLNSIISKNTDVSSSLTTLNNIFEKSLYWLFRQLSKTIQREEHKNTLLWQNWQTNITENGVNNILKAGESLSVVIGYQDYDNREDLIALWGKIEDCLLALHDTGDMEQSGVVDIPVNEVSYKEESVVNIKNNTSNSDECYQQKHNNQGELLASLVALRFDNDGFRKQLNSYENKEKKSRIIVYASLCLGILSILLLMGTGFVILNLQTKVVKLTELVSILEDDVSGLSEKNPDQAINDKELSAELLDQGLANVVESNQQPVKEYTIENGGLSNATEQKISEINKAAIEENSLGASQSIAKLSVNNGSVVAKKSTLPTKSTSKKEVHTISEKSNNLSGVTGKVASTKEVIEKTNDAMGWVVNLTAFNEQKEAKKKAAYFAKKGITVKVISVPLRNKTWYQLQVTGFKNKKDAASYAEKIKKSENLHAVSLNNR